MSDIRIERVASKKDLRKFIKFPWKVYKGDNNWVPPLILDMKEKLDKKKDPFFEHAEMELFLAFKDGEISGRIAAVLDESHNRTHDEKIVFFGLYESFNDFDIAKILLDEVKKWGKAKGMDVLRGPMNLSMNDECAFLLEGFDSPPVVMMTYNPRYYLDLMEKYGLVKAKDLYAFFMSKDHETEQRVDKVVEKARKSTSVTFRRIDLKKIKQEVEKIKYVYNQSWEKNWGFVPWTDNEMEHMAKKLKQMADPSLIILAEDKGQPVGFAFGLPNYNEILIKMNGRLLPLGFFKLLLNKKKIEGMRGVVFGILPDYRMSGLSYILYSEFEKSGLEAGYKWGETSWQLEDNHAINHFVASIGGKVYKKYRIFEQKFE